MIIGQKEDYKYRITRPKGRTLVAICDTCGKKFERSISHFWKKSKGKSVDGLLAEHHYCCTKCRRTSGSDSGTWRGGKSTMMGYVILKVKNHPQANQQGYIMEHRIVLEKLLGRYLKLEEVVHHINGDRLDNREENLMLFDSNGDHLSYHKELRHKASLTL